MTKNERIKQMKKKVILLLFAGLFVAGNVWSMGRKPPLPSQEQNKIETKQPPKTTQQKRTFVKNGKEYKILSLRETVESEDIIYDIEIQFKKRYTSRTDRRNIKKI